jgi:hypothetical protein
MKTLGARLPRGVVPVGDDPSGNLVCLDCRTPDEPPVLFWDHETASITQIAKSLDDFVLSLREREPIPEEWLLPPPKKKKPKRKA